MNTRTTAAAIALAMTMGLGLSTTRLLADDKVIKPTELEGGKVKTNNPGVRQLTAEEIAAVQSSAKGQATPPVTGELPKALELSESSFDWGTISDAEPVSHTLKIKNITDRTIKLAVAASCGCTVPKLEKDVLAPGEEVPVSASFNPSGRNGPQTKTVTVTVTDPQGVYAQQAVTLTSNVRALVTLDPPKLFSTDVDHRDGKIETLTVIGRKPNFKVDGVDSTSPFVKAKVGESVEVEENGEKITKVTIELDIGKDAPIGSLNSQLTIRTNDDKTKPLQTFVGADVIGDIRATPPSTMIRATAPGAAVTAQMKLDTRSGKPFRITSIDIEGRADMKLVSDFASTEEGRGYMLTISGVAPEQAGLVQGSVVVATDAQGGETIRVPFTLTVPRTAPPKPAVAPTAPAAPAAPKDAPLSPMAPKK